MRRCRQGAEYHTNVRHIPAAAGRLAVGRNAIDKPNNPDRLPAGMTATATDRWPADILWQAADSGVQWAGLVSGPLNGCSGAYREFDTVPGRSRPCGTPCSSSPVCGRANGARPVRRSARRRWPALVRQLDDDRRDMRQAAEEALIQLGPGRSRSAAGRRCTDDRRGARTVGARADQLQTQSAAVRWKPATSAWKARCPWPKPCGRLSSRPPTLFGLRRL